MELSSARSVPFVSAVIEIFITRVALGVFEEELVSVSVLLATYVDARICTELRVDLSSRSVDLVSVVIVYRMQGMTKESTLNR